MPCLSKLSYVASLTDCHVQQLAGPDNAKQAVDVVKHDQEHLCLCGWWGLHDTEDFSILEAVTLYSTATCRYTRKCFMLTLSSG